MYFDRDKPNWIPHRTSYYKKNWGFCVNMHQLSLLIDPKYHVVIDSNFSKSQLEVGEIYFSGKSKHEIVFTTYICHPSMANNELSGPVVLNVVAQHLVSRNNYYFRSFYQSKFFKILLSLIIILLSSLIKLLIILYFYNII